MYHGWKVVLTAFSIALFGWGVGFYGVGVLLAALQTLHGWPATVVSGAVTVYYLVGAALIFFVGDAMARWGPRAVTLAAVAAMGTGALAVAHLESPWQLYLAFPLMAAGWAGMSGAAINTLLAPWFERRRGLAVSLALNGASLGGVIVAPLALLAIDRFGLRAGVLAVVLAMWAVLLPLLLAWLHRGPHVLGLAADGAPAASATAGAAGDPRVAGLGAGEFTRARFLRSRGFWTIAVPFALGLVAQVGLLIHLVAYLRPLLGLAGAGAALSLASAMAVVGRLALGLVVDRVERRAAAAANFLLQAAAVGVLVIAREPWALFAGCALFGLGVGNMITLPSLIVQVEFPRAAFGQVVSTVTAINQFTFAFGPGLIGLLRDATGSYRPALAACGVLLVLATAVVLWGRRGVASGG